MWTPGSESPSSRRAWIEIGSFGRLLLDLSVALLAEGVDRNLLPSRNSTSTSVALLAEGVDRNFPEQVVDGGAERSPSSRRAWIEIGEAHDGLQYFAVALLAEGVDRNSQES